MNETQKNVSPPRRGFFRRQFSWRGLRRALIGLLVVVTLIGLLVTEENWRGKHAWESYRHEWEAKGERFGWQAFVPPAGPDDQNFLAAPIFTRLASGKTRMSTYRSDGSYPEDAAGYWLKGTMVNLKSWQTYYRNSTNTSLAKEFPMLPQPQAPANDVLFALSQYDSEIEALRGASLRPDASIPIGYDGGFNNIPSLDSYFMVLKRCSGVLQLRAIAELAGGQSTNALDDIKLLFRLNDSIRNSPYMISHLVRIAITSVELQPVWEGLAEHQWTDGQLVSLEGLLAKEDFLADYKFTIRGERAFAIASLENQRRTREIISDLPDGGTITNKIILMPAAYFYRNELAFARASREWLLPLVDTDSRIVSPKNWRRIDDAIHEARKHYSLYTVQANGVAPALNSAPKLFAYAQTGTDLARVACALERYRLEHGNYPRSLDALAPQFLAEVPHDIINGQPLHYRLKPNGQFILYSVGWNETDDGGQVVVNKYGTVDRDQGDWVWQYPAK